MSDQSEPGTALAVIPPSSLPTIIAADTNDILGKLKAALRDYVPDATTEKGRDDIGRKKRTIGVAKMDFKRLKDGILEDAKKTVASVNAEYKIIETNCDALRDAIDSRLEAYKQIERDRLAGHEAAFAEMDAATNVNVGAWSDDIRTTLEAFKARPPRDWQEFTERAKAEYAAGLKHLEDCLAGTLKAEADAAELDRLRAEHAERERQEAEMRQQEREERIAAEAAERARRDAEAKAEAAKVLAEHKAREEREAIERQRQEAEQAAKRAQEAAERAERERQAAVARAEQDRVDAEHRAEVARKEAAAQSVDRERIAVEAERKRAADAKAAEETETARRTADKAHRAKINNEAMAGLVAAGLDDKAARAAAIAIARGAVQHVTISY